MDNTPHTKVSDILHARLHDHSHAMLNMLTEQHKIAQSALNLDCQNHWYNFAITNMRERYEPVTNGIGAHKQMHSILAFQQFGRPVDMLLATNHILAHRVSHTAEDKQISALCKALHPLLTKAQFDISHVANSLSHYIDSLNAPDTRIVYPSMLAEADRVPLFATRVEPFTASDFKKEFDAVAPEAMAALKTTRDTIATMRGDTQNNPIAAQLLGIYDTVLSTMEQTIEKTHIMAMARPIEPVAEKG
ncbi:MAG: hypothetical protein C0436_01985 [Alphaproteobacteria bacterium]|nr:hypothetical protein [Alphaproteobacteria bacterium]